MGTKLQARSIPLLAGLIAVLCPAWLGAQEPRMQYNATTGAVPNYVLQARVVAVGVRDVGGVREIGFFHAGGPIASNPEFLLKTRPGRVLDPGRILVATGSNFGAALASSKHAPGSILSIDPQTANAVVVAHDFAGCARGRPGNSGHPGAREKSCATASFN